MEISDAVEFLKRNHHGVLVARKRDGSLQMTLVSPVVDSQGRLIITARQTTYKVRNIKRDPRISLLVFGEEFHGSKYIQVDGTAEIIPQPEAIETVIDWRRQLKGEHPDWEEFRRHVIQEGRIVLRVRIEKVGPQRKK